MAYNKVYLCKECKEEIKNKGWDAYTDQYWVRCDNKDCSEYNKVKTYVDIKEYEVK